ncbi:MAG: 6-phosphogluconolactonase [Deltaproteobacteria bacterium]|nr:6-phosphogluconolactonase [Deltaproteobacteria bacterium]
MNRNPNVYIREDGPRSCAMIFLDLCYKAIKHDGAFAVVLSGGKTPGPLLSLLASDEFRNRVPWKSVHLFWGDERCVPPDHPDSNYGNAEAGLISKVELPPENVHRMRGEVPPRLSAAAYEEELRRFFAEKKKPCFDLVILGLGADGHTLSLYPGSNAVVQTDRLVAANHIEALGAYRITMTLAAVNDASNAVFLVTGKEKSGILKAVLEDNGEEKKYPAAMINPAHGRLIWIVDREAAALL